MAMEEQIQKLITKYTEMCDWLYNESIETTPNDVSDYKEYQTRLTAKAASYSRVIKDLQTLINNK